MIGYRLVRVSNIEILCKFGDLQKWLETLLSSDYIRHGRELSFKNEDDAIIFKLKFPELIHIKQ